MSLYVGTSRKDLLVQASTQHNSVFCFVLFFFPFQMVVTSCQLAHVAELCFPQEEN